MFYRRHKEVIGLHHYEANKPILSAGATHADVTHPFLKFSVIGADLSNPQLLNTSSTILFIRIIPRLNFGMMHDTHL